MTTAVSADQSPHAHAHGDWDARAIAPTAPILSAGRLRMGIVTTGAMVVANLAPFTIGAIGPLITDDLNVDKVQLGMLFTAMYLSAAFWSPWMGHVVGRIGFERGIDMLLLSAMVSYSVVAVVPGFSLLMLGAILCGIAPALANPVTNLGLAQLPGKRGVLMGIKQSGVQGAAVLAALVMAPLALAWGWRYALAACSGFTLLVWVTLVTSRRTRAVPTRSVAGRSRRRSDVRIRRMYVYAFFMGLGTGNVTAYLALFGAERLSMSDGMAASLVAVLGICGVLGRILWGYVADRVGKGPRGGYALLTVVAGLAMGSTVLLLLSEVAWFAIWIGTATIGLSGAAWNGLLMLIIVNRTSAHDLPRVSGQIQAVFFFGLCVGPPVFGFLIERTGEYSWSWAWVSMAFAVSLLTMLGPCRTGAR